VLLRPKKKLRYCAHIRKGTRLIVIFSVQVLKTELRSTRLEIAEDRRKLGAKCASLQQRLAEAESRASEVVKHAQNVMISHKVRRIDQRRELRAVVNYLLNH
jgi:hypothetical protein